MAEPVESRPVLYVRTRQEWRAWLEENFDTAAEVWFTFPTKVSGETGVSYNDAVEEALCFGWIDSTIKSLDEGHRIQRFSPRNPRSTYSQSNKERLRWLTDHGLIHESVTEEAARVLAEPFVWPQDIMEAIQADPEAWAHFQTFSPGYKRIRVAYIDAARVSPDELTKRLNNFLAKTRTGTLITGYGGIGKHY
ncbi:MAG: YdeI/OmpD-associated family protein [Micrococcales bacterium]|nr:YdeI/OmpD-associated family protein [Micrococcales bacterium]